MVNAPQPMSMDSRTQHRPHRPAAAALLALALALASCSDETLPDGPPQLPDSESLMPLTWERPGEPIRTYVIRNSGGILSSCHTLVSRPLPMGLRVQVSDDRRNCEITGRPQVTPAGVENKLQTIYATNRHGTDSVVVTVK